MLILFRFTILLITSGIVSVADALSDENGLDSNPPNDQLEPTSPFSSTKADEPPISRSSFGSTDPLGSRVPSELGSPVPASSVFGSAGQSEYGSVVPSATGPKMGRFDGLHRMVSNIKEVRNALEKISADNSQKSQRVEKSRQCCEFLSSVNCRNVEEHENCKSSEWLIPGTSGSIQSYSGPFADSEEESNPSTQDPTKNGDSVNDDLVTNGNIVTNDPAADDKIPVSEENSPWCLSVIDGKPNNGYVQPTGLDDIDARILRLQVVDKHNVYRDKYGLDRLKLNDTISAYAQHWANHLVEINELKRRPNRRYGENLFAGSRMKRIGAVGTDVWYNELRNVLSTDKETELFKKINSIRQCTQLLWKPTKEMGVGVAKSPGGTFYIVANYSPRGNWKDALMKNLPPFSDDDINAAKEAYRIFEEKKKTQITNRNDDDDQAISMENTSLGLPNFSISVGGEDVIKCEEKITIIEGSTIIEKLINEDRRNAYTANLPEKIKNFDYPFVKPLNIKITDVEAIRDDVLEKTNYYRARYSMPKLSVDKQLTNYAQNRANELAETKEFINKPQDFDYDFGENLHCSPDMLYVGEVAVDLWFYEISQVKVGDTDKHLRNKDEAGQLTQLLWKVSENMGIGAAKDSDGKVYIAAYFNPSGNAPHFYIENLPKFTQEDIDEGIAKKNQIKKSCEMLQNPPLEGTLPELPGWTSLLHKKKKNEKQIIIID